MSDEYGTARKKSRLFTRLALQSQKNARHKAQQLAKKSRAAAGIFVHVDPDASVRWKVAVLPVIPEDKWTHVRTVRPQQWPKRIWSVTDERKARTILRDIVAQWRGADWCQDAVDFLEGRDQDKGSTDHV